MEKRSQHIYFPVNIAKFLRTPIWKNICERLLQSLETYMTYNKNNPAFMNNLRRGKTAHSHKSLVAASALLVLHVSIIDYTTAQIELARKSLIRWQAREIQQHLHSNIYIYIYIAITSPIPPPPPSSCSWLHSFLKLFCLLFWLTNGTHRLTKVTVCEPQLKFIAQFIPGCFFPDWMNPYEILRSVSQLLLASQLVRFFYFSFFFNISLAQSQPALQFRFDKQVMLYHAQAASGLVWIATLAKLAGYLNAYNHVDTVQQFVSYEQRFCSQLPTLVSQLNFRIASFDINS